MAEQNSEFSVPLAEFWVYSIRSLLVVQASCICKKKPGARCAGLKCWYFSRSCMARIPAQHAVLLLQEGQYLAYQTSHS